MEVTPEQIDTLISAIKLIAYGISGAGSGIVIAILIKK